ncbi:hypothetical protein DOY81_003364 [Sarcophaga bullata]|nr:hypothetical protein DOY81_003364 [Sarcophaga bullata]
MSRMPVRRKFSDYVNFLRRQIVARICFYLKEDVSRNITKKTKLKWNQQAADMLSKSLLLLIFSSGSSS